MIIFPQMFNEKLALALKQRNIKPTELARRARISDAAISRYLKGEREPSIDALISIADALGVGYEEILSWFKSGSPKLKQESRVDRMIGLFLELNKDEQEIYLESIEVRVKKKGASNEEGKSRKQVEKPL